MKPKVGDWFMGNNGKPYQLVEIRNSEFAYVVRIFSNSVKMYYTEYGFKIFFRPMTDEEKVKWL